MCEYHNQNGEREIYPNTGGLRTLIAGSVPAQESSAAWARCGECLSVICVSAATTAEAYRATSRKEDTLW